jgi:hypothetical protein
MEAPTATVDNAATSAVAHYLQQPDPLVLELCENTGPHEWTDAMLEEFATSLVVSWPPEDSAHGCPPAMTTAPQEEEASLVDTYSPAKA